MKLTLRSIEAAEPREAEYVLWDHELSCFGVRVRPGGAKTFIARTRVGKGRSARKVTITLGKPGIVTVEDARRKARAAIADAAAGNEPARPESQTGPANVAALCQLWVEKAALRSRQRGKLAGQLRDPKNIAIDVGRINAHIVPLLGKVRLADLNPTAIARFRDAVARGETAQETKTKPRGVRRVRGGEGTASRTLRLLSSILSFGVREGYLDANPALGVEKTPDRSMERFLSPEEMRRLGEALVNLEAAGAPPAGLAIIRMLALSGARKGEIERLKWAEVDLRTGFLRLAGSKTGAKLIPITGPMRAILDERANFGVSGYVFASLGVETYFQGTPKLWLRARKRAGLDDVRLHDLRHSAASFGLAGGLGLEVIGKLLGHADVKTTKRYAHLSEGHVRAAAETMADGIAGLLSPSLPESA
ncbi:MAG: tyrosine-type recombinase/integrase [Caulobacterales bacterium]